jgi:hypothetical protein
MDHFVDMRSSVIGGTVDTQLVLPLRMRRVMKILAVLASLSLAATAQAKNWSGTWTATAGAGKAFGGTWDAASGDDPNTVQGSFAVVDPSGTTLAAGTWAARKDAKTWQGSWQARAASGQVFSGTWRAQAQLPSTASFAELFELAATQIVRGTWAMGAAYSGAWSIRTYTRQ